jgi:hypothetical protein
MREGGCGLVGNKGVMENVGLSMEKKLKLQPEKATYVLSPLQWYREERELDLCKGLC